MPSEPPSPRPGWVDYSAEMQIRRNPVLRVVYLALGLLAVGLGALGVIVPGLPTTVFALLAAFFFARSSPRFYNWLMNHPLVGPTLRDLREGRGVPRRVKRLVPPTIALAAGSSALWLAFGLGLPWIGALVALVGLVGVAYVLRLPTKRDAP